MRTAKPHYQRIHRTQNQRRHRTIPSNPKQTTNTMNHSKKQYILKHWDLLSKETQSLLTLVGITPIQNGSKKTPNNQTKKRTT